MVPVCDLCDQYGDSIQVLIPIFTNYGQKSAFFGAVETIRTHEDNSKVRDSVLEDGCGRVLVVDGGASVKRSLLGGDLASKAAENSWVGIVINGAVRDSLELANIDIGILALNLVPMKTEKRGLGSRGIPISIAGASINSGDWIYADQDGIIISTKPLHNG